VCDPGHWRGGRRRLPLDRHAVRRDCHPTRPKRPKPARQPEAVATGFEGKRNPRDLATGPDRLIAPAMHQANTGYKIFERYKEHGLEALTNRSRRPVRYANQLPRQIESLIVAAKRNKPHWGARKIRELSWSADWTATSAFRPRARSTPCSTGTAWSRSLGRPRHRATGCYARAKVNQLELALSDCNQSLSLEPSNPQILDSRGFRYLKIGNLDNAIADFEAALRLDSQLASSLYGRGIAKRKKGDSMGSNADIAAAKSIQPNIDQDLKRDGFE
jgi:tetratricopeptide (TPR) repeat protein